MEDLKELFQPGMLILYNKLKGVNDDVFINRCTEIWIYFIGSVFPIISSALLPLGDLYVMALVHFRDLVIWPLRARFDGITN